MFREEDVVVVSGLSVWSTFDVIMITFVGVGLSDVRFPSALEDTRGLAEASEVLLVALEEVSDRSSLRRELELKLELSCD